MIYIYSNVIKQKRENIQNNLSEQHSLTEYTGQRSDMLLLMLYKCTLKILFFYTEKSSLTYNANIFSIFY